MNERYYSADQDIHFTLTTPAEETALWVKARAGCEEAKTFLITNHLLFARTQALGRVSLGALPQDEIISAANMAVMKAFQSFDHRLGFRFSTYLRPFVKGEIAALWESKFSGQGVPDPSIATWGAPPASVSGESFAREPEDPNTPRVEPEAELLDLKRFNRAALASAIGALSSRGRALLEQVYFQGHNFADVARKRGTSREAVRREHNRLVEKLKSTLTALGVKEVA